MTISSPEKRIVMAMTGASGVLYGRGLLRQLLDCGMEVHLIVSRGALLVMKEELGETYPDPFDSEKFLGVAPGTYSGQVVLYNERDLAAAPASGTFRHQGMVICPCSMKTLSSLAHGTSESLVGRAGDACLKERRRLVVVPRETPLNLIHLRNMVAITEAGATVLPAAPGFYHKPKSLDDLVDHVVLKILDQFGLSGKQGIRWKDAAK